MKEVLKRLEEARMLLKECRSREESGQFQKPLLDAAEMVERLQSDLAAGQFSQGEP